MVEQWTENPCVSGSIPLLDMLKRRPNVVILRPRLKRLEAIYDTGIYKFRFYDGKSNCFKFRTYQAHFSLVKSSLFGGMVDAPDLKSVPITGCWFKSNNGQ